MSREKKKGTSGNAKAYITRAKALRKLQLSLPEFRRLCIVKGIYPRDPRKKTEGADKTYYLSKDIDFLAHERLIRVMRAQTAHRKKVTKARAKRQRDVLRALARSAPRAKLDHIVLERYPQFSDALRELDDPLCTVALFANLPANQKARISAQKVATCKKLLNEFHNFVAETGALRKAFVSIKGYYYQAVIMGETITWITPHRFTQVLPQDVDYSVMLTFLDLYKCIMSFVNFKLYTTHNMAYPPRFSREAMAKGLELSAYENTKGEQNHDSTLTPRNAKNGDVTTVPSVAKETITAVQAAAAKMAVRDDESDHEDDEGDDDAKEKESAEGSTKDHEKSNTDQAEDADEDADEDEDEIEESQEKLSVFQGKSVVIGREVPYIELEFVLKSAGAAKVTREDDLSVEAQIPAEGYTHWIIDRPAVAGRRNMSIEYVQPQYVFDSVNNGMLLPPSLYGPDAKLPPHLSPFVSEEDDGGYRPWYKDVLERIKSGDESVVAEAAAVVYAEDEERKRVKRVKQRQAENDVKRKAKEKEEANRKIGDASGKTKSRRQKSKAVPQELPEKDEEDQIEIQEDDKDAQIEKDTTSGLMDDGQIEDSGESGSESESPEEAEEDEEEAEIQQEKVEKEQEDKDEKELAKIMMSKKKMKKYRQEMKDVRAKEARRKKLTAKRRALELASKQSSTSNKKAKRQLS